MELSKLLCPTRASGGVSAIWMSMVAATTFFIQVKPSDASAFTWKIFCTEGPRIVIPGDQRLVYFAEQKRLTSLDGDRPSRSLIESIQYALIELGYNPGQLDGIFGPRTSDALSSLAVNRCSIPGSHVVPAAQGLTSEIGNPESPALTPGSRPVQLLATAGDEGLVARYVISWGYNSADGEFVDGGRASFGSAGGILWGEIPSAYAPDEIEVTYSIDYRDPGYHDVMSKENVPVSASGAHLIVSPTAVILEPNFLIKIDGSITPNDFLIFSWKLESDNASQLTGTERSIWFQWPELSSMESNPTAIEVRTTLPTDSAEIQYHLAGQISGNSVSYRGSLGGGLSKVILFVVGSDGRVLSSEHGGT